MNQSIDGTDGRVPLMIGAIGHIDLVPNEVTQLGERVRTFLTSLQKKYPDLRVTLLTSLAEGADRLVADVAEALGVEIIYVLPMPTELFERDFGGASLGEYRQTLRGANVLTLPLIGGNTADEVTHPGPARDLQYAGLGAFIAAHCHILLALWDGSDDGPSGGTASIIRYHQEDYMPGFTDGVRSSRLDDTDDESDLVYHIVCSRDRPNGAPSAPLKAGDAWWLSRNDKSPRTPEMPRRYDIVLRRMVEFSQDVVRNEASIEREPNSLLSTDPGFEIGAGDRAIAELFWRADWLARHYRGRTHAVLRVLYVFAGLAGFCFMAYSNLTPQDLPAQATLIYPYLVFMAVSFCAYLLERRRAWQRRYIEYRVLAEALRVQFYWAIAGVPRPAESRFGHDAFLKREDLELGWLRNMLRVSGLKDDASGHAPPESGIEIAERDWVRDQTRYYSARWPELLRPHRVGEVLRRLSYGAGLALPAWLAFNQFWFGRQPTGVMFTMMGLLPIVATVLGEYAERKSSADQISNYQFMERILANAQRQLRRTTKPAERRQILRDLGDAALHEHSQWILRQRERPISTVS